MHNIGRPSTANHVISTPCSTSTTLIHSRIWGQPELINWYEYPDRLECVYIENRLLSYYPEIEDQKRVYKIIYSCVDGKWNKSQPIYGEIIPATDEEYHFND